MTNDQFEELRDEVADHPAECDCETCMEFRAECLERSGLDLAPALLEEDAI